MSKATDVSQGGYLMKKNQVRWFCVKNHVLYWFTEKQDLSNDFNANSRGSLALATCDLSMHSKTAVKLITSEDNYVLKEKSKGDISLWFDFLIDEIQKAKDSVSKFGKFFKEGWLKKKGKDRWFRLKGTRLFWFSHENSGTPNGNLDLERCTVSSVQEDSYFNIGASYKNKVYRIDCPNGIHEARAWVKVIDESIKKGKNDVNKRMSTISNLEQDIRCEGTATKKGKERYFILQNGNLLWYLSNPNSLKKSVKSPKNAKGTKIQGTLNLANCEVSRDGFSLNINPARGKPYQLTFSNIEDAKTWYDKMSRAIERENFLNAKYQNALADSEVIRSNGWLEKRYIGSEKKHKRFCLLDKTALKYYDTDDWTNSTPKGEIQLTQAGVTRIDDTAFTLNSLDGRSFPWVAENETECQEWVDSLNIQIIKTEILYAKAEVTKHGYLGKKGEERWFAIKDRILYWYNHVVSPDFVGTEGSNGSFALLGCNVTVSASEYFFTIESEEKSYKLICKSELDLNNWIQAIEVASSESKAPGLVFGSTLEEIIEREGKPIPRIISDCVAYIREHGPSTQGIFRLSGQALEIQEYVSVYDVGDFPDFERDSADVNATAGLLKLFLRELADPLIPSCMYKQFLAAKEDHKLFIAIHELPSINYEILKYVMEFLNFMTHYSGATCMEASNIAIVFGPNIIRCTDENQNLMASSFMETPMILRTTQQMIEHYEKFFSGEQFDGFDEVSMTANLPPPMDMPVDLPPPMDIPGYLPPIEMPADLPPIEIPLDLPPVDLPPMNLPPVEIPASDISIHEDQ